MIANLTRGAKTASLHLPADRFQIAGVLSYLGVDRLDDYELPAKVRIPRESWFRLNRPE